MRILHIQQLYITAKITLAEYTEMYQAVVDFLGTNDVDIVEAVLNDVVYEIYA